MRWRGGSSGTNGGVREPAVAGQFYAGRSERLAAEVDGHLAAARKVLKASDAEAPGAIGTAAGPGAVDGNTDRLIAVVAPHAGHIYSGPTAGFAYASIDPSSVRRVVLLGPAHYVPIGGIGLSSATTWRTPLGDVPVDAEVGADLREHFDDVFPGDAAHAPEHSLEVQLPFLQRMLTNWTLVPLIVGADLPEELAAVIARCAALPQTLVVVSTDLSHYLDHDAAVARDARTIAAVVDRRAEGIGPQDACGRYPLRGLLRAAASAGWSIDLLDARNSGDTAGDWDRVVGYAAFAVRDASPARGAESDQDEATSASVMESDQDPPRVHDTTERETAAAPVGGARIGAADRCALLRLARGTIRDALETGRRPHVDLSAWPDALRQPGAAFVTLRSAEGQLLGCIGSLAAHQPLVRDVAEHAYDAAFRDPRFPPMTRERAEGMVVDISVLTAPEPFRCSGYQDLLARVPVGSGVVVTAGRHRATFLPAVWAELPDATSFLAALWRKAGLRPSDWPAGTTIEVYASQEFAESDF